MIWVCDHDVDCSDGSDENQCNTLTCATGEFACADHLKCIFSRWVCDMEPDCDDASDELHCPEPTCDPNYFQCADTQCIPLAWICDGDRDCENDSDEANCQALIPLCGELFFQCKSGDCIPKAWRCDQENDCGDNSDEDISICPNASAWSEAPTLETDEMPIIQDETTNAYSTQEDTTATTTTSQVVTTIISSTQEDTTVCTTIAAKTTSVSTDANAWSEAPTSETDEMPIIQDETTTTYSTQEDTTAATTTSQVETFTISSTQVDTTVSNTIAAKTTSGLCQPGYKFNRGIGECRDVDECEEIWGACSQICINHNGSFTCKCQEGFQLINHTHCKAVGQPPAVVYVYNHNIRKFNLSTYENEDLFTELPDPRALEVDVEDGIVFWSDFQEQKIMMGYLNGLLEPRVAVNDIYLVIDISYDWIHKNVYWIDTFENTINVASRDGGHHKTLIRENLDEPVAIAVDPRTGYMYWTDCGASPKIERAGMNGAYRQIIIDNNKVDIQLPKGLTIDYPSDMLYWMDARRHLLATCDFNGGRYRVILQNEAALVHPSYISVFEDEVYWTDRDALSVRRVNKFNRKGVSYAVPILFRGRPGGLSIWHSSKQPSGENYCATEKARCSHLCVASPEGPMQLLKYTCLCPDGIDMSSDGFTCSGFTPRLELSKTTESNRVTDEGFTTRGNGIHLRPNFITCFLYTTLFTFLIANN